MEPYTDIVTSWNLDGSRTVKKGAPPAWSQLCKGAGAGPGRGGPCP